MAGRGRGGRGRGRPPGRPRRASSSSVESVRTSQPKYVKESSILKPILPQVHSDDWPCFVLNDAVVYQKDWRTLGNLLLVDQEGPLFVRGRLEIDHREHRGLVVRNTPAKTYHVELSPTHSYSIGFGPCCIWASGGAGWFEINPSPKYQAMYDEMCEAIHLYYTVMDVYENAKKKQAKPGKKQKGVASVPIEEVLLKYAVAVGSGMYRNDVEELCDKHHQFLFAHFGKETQFKWSSTSFYQWLKNRHPDADIKQRTVSSSNLPAVRRPSHAELDDDSDSMADHSGVEADRTVLHHGKKGSRAETDSDEDEEDVEMKDASDSSESSRSRKPISTRLTNGMFEKPLVLTPSARVKAGPQPDIAQQSSLSHVPSPPISVTDQTRSPAPPVQSPIEFLLEFLDEVEQELSGDSLSRNSVMSKIRPATVHSKLYYRCSIKEYKAAPDITQYYSKALLKSLPERWHSSPFYAWLKSVANKPFEPQILSIEEIPLRCVRRNTMRKPSSSTLPKAGKTSDGLDSDSSSKKGGKRLHAPLVGRPSGKAAGLRLAVKRPLDSDDETDDRVVKAAKPSDSSDPDEDDSHENSDADSSDDQEEASIKTEAVRIVVKASKVPSMSPTGPNGTWVCEEPGCRHVVRGADEPEGQDLVSAHFRYHEERAAKMNIAVDEGTRGHLPIDNLLEKIKAFGEMKRKSEEVVLNGVVLPKPIKRKLFV